MSKQIDGDRKICYVKTMGRRKAVFWISLFIILSYMAAPLVDSITCTECLGPLQLTVNKSNVEHSRLTHVSPSRSIHSEDANSLYQAGARSFCAICANVSGPPPSHYQPMSLILVPVEPEVTITAPVSPRHPIYRPPEIV